MIVTHSFYDGTTETYWIEMDYSTESLTLYYPTVMYIVGLMHDEVTRDSELDLVDDICDRIDCYYEMFERYGDVR
jgi:hypothetical protein